ncbi:MAG: PEP-CTERM sorting domain-containing protein [Planctomycetia bacterium]|nr:PEP-CTERM sorting domain-containing protein [Planctomycetia bacterium]
MSFMNRFASISCWGALSVAVLLGGAGVNRLDARGVTEIKLNADGTGSRYGSSNGSSYQNGDDIHVLGDKNCTWVFIQNTSSVTAEPSFWSNNFEIAGTGFNSEGGGALRFGEGQTTLTHPMIVTGNVTLTDDARIGVHAGSVDAVGMITGKLGTTDAGNILSIRSGGVPGILVLTADNTDFTSNIQVKGGVLQLGSTRGTVTATGYEWVPTYDDAGNVTGEVYQQNTAKEFNFDGSTGSVSSAEINVTSEQSGYNSTLRFQRSGEVTINNKIVGTGLVELDGTATYTLGETGSIADTIAKVTVTENATWKLQDSSEVAVNNQIVNEGTLLFSGGGDYTLNKAVTNGKLISVAEDTKVTFNKGYTKNGDGAITGSGFVQLNHPDGDEKGDFPNNLNVTDFTGVLIAGTGYRWSPASNTTYDLGAMDGGQIRIYNGEGTTYNQDFYISGDGWATDERYGAIRFASDRDETATAMQVIAGDVHLMGDARISAHYVVRGVGLISGNIDGNHTLSIGASLRSDRDTLGSVILTGENSYGATFIDQNDTLVIGWQGSVNNVNYDGTTGTLGTGAVEIAAKGTLKFLRSNEYTLGTGNSIKNQGTLIFGGGGTYKMQTGITSNGLLNINADTKLIVRSNTSGDNVGNAINGSGSLKGDGFLQINLTNNDTFFETNIDTIVSLDKSQFNGVVLAGERFRWQNPSNVYSKIGAVDGGQIFLKEQGTDFTNEMYLAGDGSGWGNEGLGVLRFSYRVSSFVNEAKMPVIVGNIHLMDDTRITAHHTNDGIGMIVGDIDGNFTLNVGGYGNKSTTGTIILTGENTYGATNIGQNDTLIVGWSGTVNNVEYDGTSGTLGTGDVSIGQNATLKFMRAQNADGSAVKISNNLNGNGTVIFDGTANYTLDVSKLASTLKSVQIADNATVTLSGKISTDVTTRFTGNGDLGINNAEFSLILATVNTSQVDAPTASLELTNDVDLGLDNALTWTFAEGTNIRMGDTLYLLAGTTDTLEDFDLSSLTINAPALASDYFWTLDTIAYGNGLVITAKMGVPEPATWVLLISGIIGLGVIAQRKRPVK